MRYVQKEKINCVEVKYGSILKASVNSAQKRKLWVDSSNMASLWTS